MDQKVLIQEKHSFLVRWTHWVNFPILTLMVWSGAMIYWANRTYWPHIPDQFFTFFNLTHRLAEGLSYHFFLMWIFILNGLVYFLYFLFSGHWKEIIPDKKSFAGAYKVVLHDLGVKGITLPANKFNDAQKMAYTGAILMGFGFIISGLAIYKPIQLSALTALLGGYEIARRIHFFLTIFIVLFFFVHVGQVAKAGWNNFRAMVSGYELKETKQESHHD